MKHSSIRAVCIVVLACIAVLSSYGDERTVDLVSIVLESFDNETNHEWRDGIRTRTYEFSWALNASKFASKSADEEGNEVNYPVMAYIDAWPIALYGSNRKADENPKSLGIHGRFDRQGYNWMDVYPVDADGAPFEIPMPGRVRYIDLWVWGSNLDFYMEAYVRDFRGFIHIVNLGNLNYAGWKNLRANIPHTINQSKRILPNRAQLSFVKFRVWTRPSEQVGNFYIYLKQFKALTDIFETAFDGDDLADPDRMTELWANSSSTN